MIKRSLKETKKGWFVSGFKDAIYNANFEVALKKYKAGDYETRHYHKLSDEITLIVSGKVEMNGKLYETDDILIIGKNEATDFKVLEDTITCVVKPNFTIDSDKYES